MTKAEYHRRQASRWPRALVGRGGRVAARPAIYLWCPECERDLWGQSGAYRTSDGFGACVYMCECGRSSLWLPGPAWMLVNPNYQPGRGAKL